MPRSSLGQHWRSTADGQRNSALWRLSRASINPRGDRAPPTYRVNAKSAADELDYADMVALSETFVQWALEGPKFTPAQHTGLMEIGVDYENLAEWVGPGWKAADPSDRPNPLRAIAELVRTSNV
jgi:hypothetical protein